MKPVYWLSFVRGQDAQMLGCVLVEDVTTLNAAWLKAIALTDVSTMAQAVGAEITAEDLALMDPEDRQTFLELPRHQLLSVEYLAARGIRVDPIPEPSQAVH